jgi:hypothetical protein
MGMSFYGIYSSVVGSIFAISTFFNAVYFPDTRMMFVLKMSPLSCLEYAAVAFERAERTAL